MWKVIYWKAILTPIYMRRMKTGNDREWVPYTEVFVFGVRIIRWGLEK